MSPQSYLRTFRLVSSALVLAVCLVLAGPAQAKNMQGKMGVGFLQTLPGARGMCLQYWAGQKLALQLLLGAEFLITKTNNSRNTLHYGIGGKYVLLGSRYANLSLGLRISGAYASEQRVDKTTDNNVWQVAAELPLEAEYFFSDAFSANVAFGIMATRVSDKGALLNPGILGGATEAGSTGIGLGTGGLIGSAGFTFYL